MTVGASPYYETVVSEVIQSHTKILKDSCYAAGIEIKEDWNIPAIGSDIPVVIGDVYNISVGSYLYHAAYGYFRITNWDQYNKTVGLLNENIKGTAAPGTFVPKCTLFIVTSKPCCVDDSSFLFPFLAEDFVAPSVSTPLVVQVTSVFGLRVGELVRIGTGLYRLQTINSSNEIVIINEGAGATPGTDVEALDANGEFQYLITAETASACAATGVLEGRIIVCDGADEFILNGEFAGQVPVLQDAADDTVKFQFLDAEVRLCTTLAEDLAVTSAISIYEVDVDDATGFEVGRYIQIGTSDLRFEITNITSNTLDLETFPNPPGVGITFVAGSSACNILTTEDLQDQIDVITTGLDSEYARLDGANTASIVTTSWLLNNNVTFGKFQQIATDRLLGRDTAGTGNVEQLTVSGGLEFSGSGTIQRSALTGDVTASAGSGVTAIGAEKVTEAMLAPDAATRSTLLFEARNTQTGTNASAITSRSGAGTGALQVAAKALKITHLSLVRMEIGVSISAGSVTATLYKGVTSTSQSITMSSGDPTGKAAAITAQSLVAGDDFHFRVSTSTLTYIGGLDGVWIQAWGHYIE